MVECYHPDLDSVEINALSTLFAAKDRFTVTDLSLAPWGYDDETLAWAIKSGAVQDLDWWCVMPEASTAVILIAIHLVGNPHSSIGARVSVDSSLRFDLSSFIRL